MPETPPGPDAFQAAQLRSLALEVMNDCRFPVLATTDGDQPRARPITPLRLEGFTLYIANLRGYAKTREIEANPRVEVLFQNDCHDQVRVTGLAEVVTDRAVLEDLWAGNALVRGFFGSLDNPDLIIYRVVPRRVRYMKEWGLEYREVPLHENASSHTPTPADP